MFADKLSTFKLNKEGTFTHISLPALCLVLLHIFLLNVLCWIIVFFITVKVNTK